MKELFERWRESERRSLMRRSTGAARRPARGMTRRAALIGIPAGLVAVVVGGIAIQAPEVPRNRPAAAGLLGTAPAADRELDQQAKRKPPTRKVPSAAALRSAWSFARDRTGLVSFAVVDSEGKLRGRDENRRYAAASVVKAMLLAAEIRRLKHAGQGIDPATDSLLRAMITRSDNDAADSIFARVGDPGLFAVAKRARMSRFTVAGHWGNAQIAAGDMARFFGDLDRVLARRHREYAKGLLGSIVESQRWGIPAAAGEKWAVRFKGGWLPDHALVHQAAELRERHGGRSLSIAILTDSQPSFEYGIETVRGVAERLLRR